MNLNELNNQLISFLKRKRNKLISLKYKMNKKIFNDRIDKCNISLFSKDSNTDEALEEGKK